MMVPEPGQGEPDDDRSDRSAALASRSPRQRAGGPRTDPRRRAGGH